MQGPHVVPPPAGTGVTDVSVQDLEPGGIGPNSVLQTLEALFEHAGQEASAELHRRAQLPDEWPDGLISEAWFIRVLRELRSMVSHDEAREILRRSGELTGIYVRANRIPAPIKVALRVLPSRLALPLLIGAFRRHAWTFAGSGRFRFEGPYPGTLVLEDAPTVRDPSGPGPACSYYEAAFQSLLALAAPGVCVQETQCQADGAAACHFRIILTRPA